MVSPLLWNTKTIAEGRCMVFNRVSVKVLVSGLDVGDDRISLAEGVGVGAFSSSFCFQRSPLVDLFS